MCVYVEVDCYIQLLRFLDSDPRLFSVQYCSSISFHFDFRFQNLSTYKKFLLNQDQDSRTSLLYSIHYSASFPLNNNCRVYYMLNVKGAFQNFLKKTAWIPTVQQNFKYFILIISHLKKSMYLTSFPTYFIAAERDN